MSKINYIDDVNFENDSVRFDSPYMVSYMDAVEKRFGKPAPAEYAAPVSAPAATPMVSKRYFKRRTFVISVVLILSVLVIAFAALSALDKIAALEDYIKVVNIDNVRDIAENAIALFEKENVTIYEYIAPIAFLVSLVLAVVILILAIVAFAAKKRIHLWIAALLALVLGLVAGGAWYMIAKPEQILDFVNPTVAGGLQYGYIIVLGLQLITFIFSCFSYKRVIK